LHLANEFASYCQIADPVTSLISSLSNAGLSSSLIVHRLQLLFFLVERHWSSLHTDIQQQIVTHLLSLLSLDEPLVQNWAFVCIGVIAVHGATFPSSARPIETSPSKRPRKSPSNEWEQAWTFAFRHLHNPATCRAAAHAAHLLVAYDRIDNAKIVSDVEGLARDMDVQGPSFPYDSVCDLFCCLLELAAHDVRLFRLELPEKILAWLTATWKPLEVSNSSKSASRTRARAVVDTPEIGRLLRLFACTCSLAYVPSIETETLLPDCAVSDFMQEYSGSAEMRDYLLEATLPPYRPPTKHHRPRKDGTLPARIGDQSPPNGLQRRLSAFLERSLTAALAEGEDDEEGANYWTTLPIDYIRQHYDVAILVLLLETLFECNGVRPNRGGLVAARQLIGNLAPCLRQARYSLSERGRLFLTLAPLFLPLDPHRSQRFVVGGGGGLVDPCPGSDVRQSSLPSASDRRASSGAAAAAASSPLHRQLWLSNDLVDSFEAALDVFRDMLSEPPATRRNNGNEDDDFGEVRAGSPSRLAINSSTGGLRDENAVAACMSICVRGLATASSSSMLRPKSSQLASRHSALVDCLVNGSGSKVRDELFDKSNGLSVAD
jgi:ataxia telangiectasia mutated family protein